MSFVLKSNFLFEFKCRNPEVSYLCSNLLLSILNQGYLAIKFSDIPKTFRVSKGIASEGINLLLEHKKIEINALENNPKARKYVKGKLFFKDLDVLNEFTAMQKLAVVLMTNNLDRDLSIAEIMLLSFLCWNSDKLGGVFGISKADIKNRVGISEQRSRRLLRGLIEKGYIIRICNGFASKEMGAKFKSIFILNILAIQNKAKKLNLSGREVNFPIPNNWNLGREVNQIILEAFGFENINKNIHGYCYERVFFVLNRICFVLILAQLKKRAITYQVLEAINSHVCKKTILLAFCGKAVDTEFQEKLFSKIYSISLNLVHELGLLNSDFSLPKINKHDIYSIDLTASNGLSLKYFSTNEI